MRVCLALPIAAALATGCHAAGEPACAPDAQGARPEEEATAAEVELVLGLAVQHAEYDVRYGTPYPKQPRRVIGPSDDFFDTRELMSQPFLSGMGRPRNSAVHRAYVRAYNGEIERLASRGAVNENINLRAGLSRVDVNQRFDSERGVTLALGGSVTSPDGRFRIEAQAVLPGDDHHIPLISSEGDRLHRLTITRLADGHRIESVETYGAQRVLFANNGATMLLRHTPSYIMPRAVHLESGTELLWIDHPLLEWARAKMQR